ncbi:MAG: hypothetical protein K2L21_06440 [Muribaculaceae bacterium]|nr:hypothetical protein [Muribaculaceae bacterium]
MKKLYTIALAAAVALSASAAVNLPAKQDRMIKLNSENIQLRKLDKTFDAKQHVQRAAAANDAPADLEGKKFILGYDLPNYNEDYTEITSYSHLSSIVTFTDGVEESDGSISYMMEGFAEGIFNGVEVLPLEAYYSPEYGQIEILGGDFLQVGNTIYTAYIVFTIQGQEEEGERLSPGLPLVFAWEDGKFEAVPTYNAGGGTIVTTSGIVAGIATANGVSVAAEFYDLTLDNCNGVMTSIIHTSKYGPVDNEDGVYATAVDGGIQIANWNGLGFDFAPTFTIDATAKTITGNTTQLFDIEGYDLFLGTANNAADLTDSEYAGKAVTAPYTVSDGQSTITVPDWNFFTDLSVYGAGIVAWFYPFTDTEIVLDIDLDEYAGINEITADNNENAPVEYFNLQGIRISEPAAGQVVIRRQGTNTTKLFVK